MFVRDESSGFGSWLAGGRPFGMFVDLVVVWLVWVIVDGFIY